MSFRSRKVWTTQICVSIPTRITCFLSGYLLRAAFTVSSNMENVLHYQRIYTFSKSWWLAGRILASSGIVFPNTLGFCYVAMTGILNTLETFNAKMIDSLTDYAPYPLGKNLSWTSHKRKMAFDRFKRLTCIISKILSLK